MRTLGLAVNIVLLIIAFFFPIYCFSFLLGSVFELDLTEFGWGTMIYDVLSLMFVVCEVYLFKCIINKKKWIEIGLSDLKLNRRHVLFVVSLVCFIYATGFLAAIISGSSEVVAVKWSGWPLLFSLVSFFIWATIEEIVFRGYLITRITDANIKPYWAVVASAILFAAAHCINPNFNIWAMVNIFLTGLLLGGIFFYTKNLYYTIIFHWLWNWIQGPILGFSVSGCYLCKPITLMQMNKENLINGGSFGFEASAVCTILLIISMAVIVAYFSKKQPAGVK